MSSDLNAALRRDLARVVGGTAVLPPDAHGPYTHDATIQRGLRGEPSAVVCPADGEAVARLLAWCYRHDVALIPRGGGTGLAGGAVPIDGGVVCSLERMNGILALEPELWRIHVQAGVSTAHVRRLARENGLMFAPDPGAAEQSQIGGNLATNAAGPHAYKYGPTGAWVTGLDVVLAPGELVSVGGRLTKDSSGYDLAGLLAGSEGTLGILTAVQLRLLPAPELAVPVVVALDSAQAGQQALLAILGGGLRPAVLEFLDEVALAATRRTYPGTLPDAARFLLLLELDGSQGEVDRQSRELAEIVGGGGSLALLYPEAEQLWRWRAGMNGAIAAQRGGKVSEDISLPVERLAQALDGIARIGRELDLTACSFGHAGDGVVHATFMVDLADADELARSLDASERALELAVTLGGSVTGEHGCGLVKRAALGRQLSGEALAAQWRIKRALDPKGLLNPGKKLPSPER